MSITKEELTAAEKKLCDAYDLAPEDFKARLRLGLKTWLLKADALRECASEVTRQQDFLNTHFAYLPDRSYRKYLAGNAAVIGAKNLSKLLDGLCALFPQDFGRFAHNPTICIEIIIRAAFSEDKQKHISDEPDTVRPDKTKQVYIGGTDDMAAFQIGVAAGTDIAEQVPLHRDNCERDHLADIQYQLGTEADAYIGLIGLQYGEKINGETKRGPANRKNDTDHRSRADHEMIEVKSRWLEQTHQSNFPPVFIYQPKPGSPFYKAVSDKKSILSAEEKDSERFEYIQFKNELKQMQDRIASWHYLETDYHLVGQVAVDLKTYRSKVLDRQEYKDADFRIPLSADLIEVPIAAQQKVTKYFETFYKKNTASTGKMNPGMCVLIESDDHAKNLSLANYIIDEGFWGDLVTVPKHIDRQQRVNKQGVWISLWHAAGCPTPPADKLMSVDHLADAIITAGRPVQLVLHNVNHIPDGVAWFTKYVWLPLFSTLENIQKQQHLTNTQALLLNVVVTHVGAINENAEKNVCDDITKYFDTKKIMRVRV